MSREQAVLDEMHQAAPCEWWHFVPCDTCYVARQQDCIRRNKPSPMPHMSRYRLGLALHKTLWLVRKFPQDVLPSCHCGKPIEWGYDGDPTHHRGMCADCDAARCDAYPMDCPTRKASR